MLFFKILYFDEKNASVHMLIIITINNSVMIFCKQLHFFQDLRFITIEKIYINSKIHFFLNVLLFNFFIRQRSLLIQIFLLQINIFSFILKTEKQFFSFHK